MRNLLKYLLMACMVMGMPALAKAADMKIGVVSANEVLQNSDAGKKAIAELNAKADAKQKELQRMNEEFKRQEDDYRKKGVTLSAEAKAKTQGELEMKARKMMEDQQSFGQQLEQEQKRLMDPLFKVFQQVLADYSKKNGYSVVLEKQALLYYTPAVDVTADVTKEFESAAKKGAK